MADDIAPAPPELDPVPPSYEAALAELERIVSDMEAGRMPLESMLSNYQRGAALLAFCRGRLEAVEQQVQRFDGTLVSPRRAP
ncbi:MAG: exodeoxyribonuclease VII small subunit [Rhodoferax sp.]